MSGSSRAARRAGAIAASTPAMTAIATNATSEETGSANCSPSPLSAPGVGQIAALVERARAGRRDVALEVDGEPGPLPASVDLGVYRILEDALTGAGPGRVGVRLASSEHDVELSVTGNRLDGEWPTPAMRERVALCDVVSPNRRAAN